MSPPSHDLTAEFATAGATFTPVELQLPEDMPLDAWAAVGRKLCRLDQVTKWWLGDWAAFGARKYGKLKEFAQANGIAYQTLRNAAWVSQAIELSRRRDNLDWTIHAEVASLKPRDQTKWLEKVQAEGLPRAELRRQIRQSQGTKNALASDGPQIRFISKACADLVHWLTNQSEDFWDEERKALWRARLKPLALFYQWLGRSDNE